MLPKDIPALADAALQDAQSLLSELVGGRRIGDEWLAPRTNQGGPGDSWSFNLRTGVWSHFGGGETGHDIVGYLAGIWNVKQGVAADRIAERIGYRVNGHAAPASRILPREIPEPEQDRPDPIPEDPPDLLPHPNHGPAVAVYRYGKAFWVARYEYPDEDGECQKTFLPWTWRGGRWSIRGYGDHAPMFHVEQLARHPDSPVMIVEGEKCAELGSRTLSAYVVVTWHGGVNRWSRTDWSPLQGRDVLIWPDADDPGREAAAKLGAHLCGIAKRVRIINPNGADPGWDIADAITRDQWDVKRIAAWAGEHAVETIKPQLQPEKKPKSIADSQTRSRTLEADAVSNLVSWEELALSKSGRGIPHVNTANGSGILQRHPTFRGHIWFDDFCGEVYHTLRGSPEPWTDMDTRRVTVFIQETIGLPKFTVGAMQDSIMHAAECNIRNPVVEYLDSLVWDGTSRLDNWLADCAGVEKNDYTTAVARNWPIGMVARAYHAGVKMDNMPVLEGVSGLNKTQFLEVLGGEWYKALPMEFGSKDFKQALRGAWLVEIPDMTGFGRVAHSQILAELSIPIDVYRQSYGRRSAKYPRTCVFAATSETSDYLSDSRGKRRYWPLRCTDINLATLRSQRDAIFAEAVQAYRAGKSWYEMPSSAADEQLARTTVDPWQDTVLDAAESLWRQSRLDSGRTKVTSEEILTRSLDIKMGDLTNAHKLRIGRILKANGWESDRTSRQRHWVKVITVNVDSSLAL